MLFFGLAGALLFFVGFVAGLVALVLRFGYGIGFRPLLNLVETMVIRIALCALVAASSCVPQPPAHPPTAPALWGRLTGGPYHVGVSVIAALDSTRPGFVVQPDSTPRRGARCRSSVWYPANSGGNKLRVSRLPSSLSAGAPGHPTPGKP